VDDHAHGNVRIRGVAQTADARRGFVGEDDRLSRKKVLNSSGQSSLRRAPFWTTAAMDGNEVEVGGREVLLNRSTARKIYSYLGSNLN